MISDTLPPFFADIVPEIPVVRSLRADANIAVGKPDIIGQEGSVIRRNLLPCLIYGLAAGIIGFIAIQLLPELF